MKINSKHYLLITLAIGSVAISGFGYWYVYSSVVRQAETYSRSLSEVDTENERKNSEQELVKMYEETLKDRARLPTLLVSEEKILNFIESVEAVGSQTSSDVTLSAINTEDLSAGQKKLPHLKTHIEIHGSWSNVMRAITMIENLPFSITINNVRLALGAGGELSVDKKPTTKVDKWNATLDIEVLTTK